jgi:tetratricopeptide (TPR) repeat protein
MQGLWKAVHAGSVILALFAVSCSAPYTAYRHDLVQGQSLLRQRDYDEARKAFEGAARAMPDAEAYALAATASYKANDTAGAWQYLEQAERANGMKSFSAFRIMAYKALVLFKTGRDADACNVLKDYTYAYSHAFISSNTRDIELVWKRKRVEDLAQLEKMLDEDVGAYEESIEQFLSTGTGYFDRNSGVSRP